MTDCEHAYGNPYCPLCGVRLHTNLRPKFPLITKVYLHSDKEEMIEKGEDLGLSDNAIRQHFMGCCYEVQINIEVYEDGTYKILSCEG